MKLAQKRNQQPRTGQPAMLGYPPNGNGGTCGPAPVTQTQSWGAACPPGTLCTSENLAASLNRAFAGERYGCRELTYWLTAGFDGGGDTGFNVNSAVTICPTRVVAIVADADGVPTLGGFMTTFTVGNQNQIAGDPLPLEALSPDSYQIIPFVTDCIKAGTPFSAAFTGGPADGLLWLGLIGPTIG